jgi:DNA-binding transcriptional LysR family regulator
LRQCDSAISDVQDIAARKRGRVIVACLPSVAYRLMPLVLARNETLHRKVRVTIRDGNLKSIIEAINTGEAQLGIASFANSPPPLDSIPIARDRFFATFPRGHKLELQKTVRWKDLELYPFISMTHETGIRDLVDDAISSMNIKLNLFSEVTNLATVYGMLEENLGISILPGLVLPRSDHPFISYRPLEKPELVRTIRLIWRHDVGLSRSAVAIIDTLSKILIEGRASEKGCAIEWHDDYDEKVIRAASRRNAF